MSVRGPPVCSSGNLLDCCVGKTLIEEEENEGKMSLVSCRRSWRIVIINANYLGPLDN